MRQRREGTAATAGRQGRVRGRLVCAVGEGRSLSGQVTVDGKTQLDVDRFSEGVFAFSYLP